MKAKELTDKAKNLIENLNSAFAEIYKEIFGYECGQFNIRR
jgi:hypothetical protein